MPVHFTRSGSTDGDTGLPDDDPNDGGDDLEGMGSPDGLFRMMIKMKGNKHVNPGNGTTTPGIPPVATPPSWLDLVIDPQTTISLHLLFTYFFSILALYLLHKNFHRFLSARQAFSLSRRSSVPARTCLVTNLPPHLRSDKSLKEYFEKDCGWKVESAMVVVEVGKDLKEALKEREVALRGLERSWTQWTGEKELPEGRIRLPVDAEDGGRSGGRSPAPPGNDETNDNDEEEDRGKSGRQGASIPPALQTYRDDPNDDTTPRWGEDSDSAPRWEEIPRAPPAVPLLEPTEQLLSETATPKNDRHQKEMMENRPMVRVPMGLLQSLMPWLGEKVDAIDYWQDKFDVAEAKVKVLREEHHDDGHEAPLIDDPETGPTHTNSNGDSVATNGTPFKSQTHRKWRPTGEAFVTFESITDAELAAQVVHFPEHSQCKTELAPDSEDVIWKNMGLTRRERVFRSVVVQGMVLFGLLFWAGEVMLKVDLEQPGTDQY